MLFCRWDDRQYGAAMIPLSPLWTWALVAALVACAVTIARLVSRSLEAAEDRRSMEQWHDMCTALDLYDWEDEEQP
jgi:hypothetical protein